MAGPCLPGQHERENPVSAQCGDKLKYSWFRCVMMRLLLLCVSKEKSGARREVEDSSMWCCWLFEINIQRALWKW